MCGRARKTIAGLSIAVGLLAAFPRAHAESPPLKSIVPDAFLDTPVGIKAGGLVFHSSVATAVIYDSNVFSTHADAATDRITLLRPSLSVSTLDPNYKFTFRSFLEHLDYDNLSTENRTDYRGEIDGKIRIRRDLELDVSATAGRVNEPRSLLRRDIPTNAAEPVAYNQYVTAVSLVNYWEPMVTTTTIGFENANYFNVRSNAGGSLNLQFLDRDVVRVAQEEELRLSHRLRLFSRQGLTASDYRDVPGFMQRDSLKFDLVTGVEVGFTPLIRGKFTFKFAEEHFNDPSILSEPQLDYNAEVSWQIRRNVRLRAGFSREFGGVSFDLDSVGGRRTRADFGIDYEITRRFFARTTLAYLHANETGLTTGGGRIEDTYQYRVMLAYQLNRYWTAFADYAFETREAETTVDQFDRQIVQAGVVARF
jgi:hypothetical protein